MRHALIVVECVSMTISFKMLDARAVTVNVTHVPVSN